MTSTNFLGIPVEGDILHAYQPPPQRPLEELRPLLQALLDDDEIVEFGWKQYTPYYADGEECLFGVSEFWVRTNQDSTDTEQENLQVDQYASPHPTLGGYRRQHGVEPVYEGSQQARYQRARALSDALSSREFDDVLQDAFGDHAMVTVRRTDIEVEFYAHD